MKIVCHNKKYKIEALFSSTNLKSALPLEVGIAEIELHGDKTFTAINDILYVYVYNDTPGGIGAYRTWYCFDPDARRWELCEDPTYKGNAK